MRARSSASSLVAASAIQRLRARAVPLGVKGPGADLPEPVLVGCAAEPRSSYLVGGIEVVGVQVVGGERDGAGGDGHGDLADQALLLHPLEGVIGQPFEGCAPHKVQRLGPQRDGGGTADRVGLSGQALEGDPVTGHALDQVALPRRGLGEVFGPDAAPELIEVVAQRLGTDLGTLRADGAQADLDLADPQVPPVVEDQVDQELLDDPAVAALEETQDLNGSHDVDGGDEPLTPSSRGARRQGRREDRSEGRCLARLEVDVSAIPDGPGRNVCRCRSAVADSLHHDHGAGEDGEDPMANPMGRPGSRPELEPVVLGAADAPGAGKGAPTHGGFFWAGRDLGTAGKLSVAVAEP